jgi:hypothetical protein
MIIFWSMPHKLYLHKERFSFVLKYFQLMSTSKCSKWNKCCLCKNKSIILPLFEKNTQSHYKKLLSGCGHVLVMCMGVENCDFLNKSEWIQAGTRGKGTYCDTMPRRPKCLVRASVISTVPSTAVIVQRTVTNY